MLKILKYKMISRPSALFYRTDRTRTPTRTRTLVCANKDLDGYLGPLGKFIEYCRITALLTVIPLGMSTDYGHPMKA